MRFLRPSLLLLAAACALCACNVPLQIADEIALGHDEITATVNGVPQVFEVRGAVNYFGIHTSGISGANAIGLHLGYGSPGKTMWNGVRDMMDSRPAASWNGTYALKDVGYLNIAEHDADIQFVSGTFEFTVIDPSTKEPIHVTDGTFHIHFITTD